MTEDSGDTGGEVVGEPWGPLVDPMTGKTLTDPLGAEGAVGKALREVEVANRRTRAVGLVLQFVAVVMLAFALFYLVRVASQSEEAVNQAKEAATQAREQSEFNARLQQIIQDYNKEHAEAAAASFAAIVENIRCFTNFFVDYNRAVSTGTPPPAKAVLDECFRPSLPAPVSPPEPSQRPSNRRPRQ